MATIVNARDVLLQAAGTRLLTVTQPSNQPVDFANVNGGTKPSNNADVTVTAVNGGITVTGGGITLSGGGSIKGGQSGYATGTGFFLGFSGGAYKFSVGNASSHLNYDGSTFSYAGDISVNGGIFQVVASTGAVIAYDFLGSCSDFANASNPALPCLTATCYSGVGYSSQPAIKAIASPSGYAIEATGQIYASAGFVGNASSATTATTATSATIATTASEVSNAGNAKMKASGGTYSAWMQTDGNFVVYHGGTPYWDATTDLSDRRLKKRITPTRRKGLAVVLALRIVDYWWRKKSPAHDGKQHTGLIAQEVRELVPDAVKDIKGTLMLHKEELVPDLVLAMQEMAAEMRDLRAQLSTRG